MKKTDITLDTIIQRNNEILASNIDGEKVMMSIKRGEYYGLGKTGTFIWDNIETPVSMRGLVDMIIKKYNVHKDQCFEDIKPFIFELIEKELIIATKLL